MSQKYFAATQIILGALMVGAAKDANLKEYFR